MQIIICIVIAWIVLITKASKLLIILSYLKIILHSPGPIPISKIRFLFRFFHLAFISQIFTSIWSRRVVFGLKFIPIFFSVFNQKFTKLIRTYFLNFTARCTFSCQGIWKISWKFWLLFKWGFNNSIYKNVLIKVSNCRLKLTKEKIDSNFRATSWHTNF